jgi:hypothetical protein
MWLYKSPRRSRHVVTCSRQSVSCLQTVEVQGCLFNKCNECSVLNTNWHLVLTKLARMSWGIHFPILLFQTNRQYLVWWTVSVTQEACRTETVPVDLRCSVTTVWTISSTQWTFPTLNTVLFLFSYLNVIYFLTNKTSVGNGLRDLQITL